MKIRMKAAIAAAATAALVFAATPAQATYGSAPSGNIVEVAVAASGGGAPDSNPRDYDILVQAVLATGLAPALSNADARLTVFAPNDRAFLRLVADLTGSAPASEQAALDAILATFSVEEIANILQYHVVGKKLGPIQVITSKSLTMLNGGVVKPRGIFLVDETSALANPRLILAAINIKATNGVIHTIDRVLVPAG